jgi:hypothetical protein
MARSVPIGSLSGTISSNLDRGQERPGMGMSPEPLSTRTGEDRRAKAQGLARRGDKRDRPGAGSIEHVRSVSGKHLAVRHRNASHSPAASEVTARRRTATVLASAGVGAGARPPRPPVALIGAPEQPRTVREDERDPIARARRDLRNVPLPTATGRAKTEGAVTLGVR